MTTVSALVFDSKHSSDEVSLTLIDVDGGDQGLGFILRIANGLLRKCNVRSRTHHAANWK
jgi:hypothetical protein